MRSSALPQFKRLIPYLFAFASSLFSVVYPEGFSSETGTVIVNYQTNEEGERLERIRFWLINQNEEQTLYPKKDEFVVNDHSHFERTVVITHLPATKYQIAFLVPNRDLFFEETKTREFELTPNSIVRLDQIIHERPKETSPLADSIVIDENKDFPLHSDVIVTQRTPTISLPLPSGPAPVHTAHLSITTNQLAPWKLMHEEQIIFSGNESAHDLTVPPGRHYYLLAKEVPDYSVQINPPNPIDIPPGGIVKLEINYQHETGFLDIKGTTAKDEKGISIKMIPENKEAPPIEIKCKPISGQVSWQSGAIATGEYVVVIEGSQGNEKQHLVIKKGKRSQLSFSFEPKDVLSTEMIKEGLGSLEVTTDISQGIYTLKNQKGETVSQGQGPSYTFLQLPPGTYTLEFSSADPRLFVPPAPQTIDVEPIKKSQIKTKYKKMGLLTVGSNLDQYQLKIVNENNENQIKVEKVTERSKNIYLEEGDYTITFEPPPITISPSQSFKVHVKSTSPQTVYHAFNIQVIDHAIIPMEKNH